MSERIENLSSFAPAVRAEALRKLLDRADGFPAESRRVNMHLHSFFSFNGEGWSPPRLAWEAKHNSLYSAAVCDFDVLHGCEEFLDAADLLQLRAAVAMETRVFFADYADADINSPGEPGVFYFMGMGFAKAPDAGTEAGDILHGLFTRAQARNRDLIKRVNEALGGFDLDYESDVLPLTPAGNATERHIVRAYHEKALEQCNASRDGAAGYWSRVLKEEKTEVLRRIADDTAMTDWLRGKLIKKGGLGYVQPTADTFPPLEEVIRMVRLSRAIPMAAWLDGTSAGESNPGEQLECLLEKGVEAVNIIPDRNWNIDDAEKRARKVTELNRYIDAARAMDLPINVGTECNKPGQRFVDDFEASPMKPHWPTFLEGAQIMVGHSRLLRYADVGYIDEAATSEFPKRAERNRFFAEVGALPVPPLRLREALRATDADQAYTRIRDSARNGEWVIK